MKRIVNIAILIFIFSSIVIGTVAACNNNGPALDGPAPNSGDGIPDGSGFGEPDNSGMGPAPNSGDGIPDGSGF